MNMVSSSVPFETRERGLENSLLSLDKGICNVGVALLGCGVAPFFFGGEEGNLAKLVFYSAMLQAAGLSVFKWPKLKKTVLLIVRLILIELSATVLTLLLVRVSGAPDLIFLTYIFIVKTMFSAVIPSFWASLSSDTLTALFMYFYKIEGYKHAVVIGLFRASFSIWMDFNLKTNLRSLSSYKRNTRFILDKLNIPYAETCSSAKKWVFNRTMNALLNQSESNKEVNSLINQLKPLFPTQPDSSQLNLKTTVFTKKQTKLLEGKIKAKGVEFRAVHFRAEGLATLILSAIIPEEPSFDPYSLDLSTVIAHDIKNALICLENINNQIMSYQELPPEKKTPLLKSIRLVEYSQILLNDLKDVKLLKTSKIMPSPKKISSVSDICSFCAEIFEARTLLTVKNVRIHTTISVESDSFMVEDIRLKQILLNLLSNSYKFTDSGMITLSFEQNGSWAFISVADTGCGMNKRQVENLNEAFKKDNSERNAKGWGIGFLIVKQLLEVIGGRDLLVKSQETKGTLISFRIPFQNGSLRQTNSTKIENRLLLPENINQERRLISSQKYCKPSLFTSQKSKFEVKESSLFEEEAFSVGTTVFKGGFYLHDKKDAVRRISFLAETELPKILLVDDSPAALFSTERVLKQAFGERVEIVKCMDGAECLYMATKLELSCKVIVSDLNMQYVGGILLEQVLSSLYKQRNRPLSFFYLSGQAVEGKLWFDKPLTLSDAKSIAKTVKEEVN